MLFASFCIEVVGLVSTLASPLTLQAPSAMVNALSIQMHLQIGEGGYSFVYCVREAGTRYEYALKKVLSAQLTAANFPYASFVPTSERAQCLGAHSWG